MLKIARAASVSFKSWAFGSDRWWWDTEFVGTLLSYQRHKHSGDQREYQPKLAPQASVLRALCMILWFYFFPHVSFCFVDIYLSAFVYSMRHYVCSVIEMGTSIIPIKGGCCNFQNQFDNTQCDLHGNIVSLVSFLLSFLVFFVFSFMLSYLLHIKQYRRAAMD